MTPIEGGYRAFSCFENYWQAGKRYEGQTPEDVEDMISWWKTQESGKRRFKGSKGKRVTHAEFDGVRYNYIESRKNIYVPQYEALVNEHILNLFGNGEKEYVIYDFDGPRDDDGCVMCKKVTVDLLRHKIEDTRFPFGHGYVVAALIAGIDHTQYA